MKPVFYTVPEICEILRHEDSTVYALLQSGKLVGHRCPGWRVRHEDLEAYLEKTRREPTAPVSRKTVSSTPRLRHLKLN